MLDAGKATDNTKIPTHLASQTITENISSAENLSTKDTLVSKCDLAPLIISEEHRFREEESPSAQKEFGILQNTKASFRPSISNSPTKTILLELDEVCHFSPSMLLPVKISNLSRFIVLFRDIFVPNGYPESVHKSYRDTIIFRMLQVTFTEMAYVIAIQANLASIKAATRIGLTVAVLWLIPDIIISFVQSAVSGYLANSIDSWPNTLKLIGYTFNAFGVFVLSLNGVSGYILWLPICAIGVSFKGVHAVVRGSTRAVFFKYSTTNNNLDESQIAIATIAGQGFGILLLLITLNPIIHIISVIILGILEILATILLVYYTNFEVLHFPRLRILANHFKVTGEVLQCSQIRNQELWTSEGINAAAKLSLPMIRLATKKTELSDLVPFEGEQYAFSRSNGITYIGLHENATKLDFIKSVVHATYSFGLDLEIGHDLMGDNYLDFYHGLIGAGWMMDYVLFNECKRYTDFPGIGSSISSSINYKD